MRAYWILPNRDQKDDILASDGKTILPLRQILDPKLRPEGFSHGVPTELLEKCGPKAFTEILFAQRFPAWLGAKRKPHQRGASENEAVPKVVRKCFKRVRAALRLVREDLGDDVYRQQNWCFRETTDESRAAVRRISA
jgi:hypothetical protein